MRAGTKTVDNERCIEKTARSGREKRAGIGSGTEWSNGVRNTPTRRGGAFGENERDRQIACGNVSDVGRRGVSPSGGIQKASRALSPTLFTPLAAPLSLYLRSSPIVTKSHVDSFLPLSYHRDRSSRGGGSRSLRFPHSLITARYISLFLFFGLVSLRHDKGFTRGSIVLRRFP